MSKNNIVKKVSSMFNRTTIKLKKHSPEILIVAGVIGTIGSTVLACKATTKLNSLLEESKQDIEQINTSQITEEFGDRYTEKDAKKDLAIVYVQTGIKVAKLYGPAVTLGAVSIASILASNNILKKRNVALVAAYTTIDKKFKEYRGRVVERFGSDVDNELRLGMKKTKIEEFITDPETEKEKKVKSTVNVIDSEVTDEYSRWFDESCKAYEGNMDYDMAYLRSQQEFANARLKADGFLFLSDIYEALGIPRTKMSQTVGWVYKPNNENGDNVVDFRLIELYKETDDGTYKKGIFMDFNVDGPILDLI